MTQQKHEQMRERDQQHTVPKTGPRGYEIHIWVKLEIIGVYLVSRWVWLDGSAEAVV